MEKEKVVRTAERVKAIAAALIGICLFSFGTSYFQERFVYRVPRILLPVFDLFGGTGLAVGMLILGGGIIFYGYTKWKSTTLKQWPYWVVAVIGLAVGVFFANREAEPGKSAEIMQEMDQNRQKQIEEIRKVEKPDFKNPDIGKYLAEFDEMYEQYCKSIADGDAEGIIKSQHMYGDWTMKAGELMKPLNNDQKTELVRYMAKLAIRWSDASGNN